MIAGRIWKIKISMRAIFFLLKIQEKLALFAYGVLTYTLCGVITQMILLENFLGLFKKIIKKIR